MLKLDKLRKQLQNQHLDAILVTNAYNRRYITGFTGTAGVAIITQDEAVFLTDFRYVSQANKQIKDFTIVQHKKSLEEEISQQLSQLGIKRLGFEEDDITFAKYSLYKSTFDAELIPVSQLIEQIRLIKSDEELSVIKDATKIADSAFEHILSFIQPGRTEIEVSNELEFFMRKEGAVSSSFDIIVASGYRSALPHGVASNKRIENGELVTLDFGALYEGYCSDITRTVAVGNINDKLQDIYHTVLEAQLRGVNGTKPGMTGHEADCLTRDHIKEKGYGDYFGHSTGHGLGMEVHESPRLAPNADVILEKGMVVTVEPGIYIPEVGGCRIEDDIFLIEGGNDILSKSPKELIQL